MRHKRLVVMAVVILFAFACYSPTYASDSIFDLYAYLDLEQCYLQGYTCVPLGCGCSIHGCFDLVCHHYPAAFIETPMSPGNSRIPILGELISALLGGVDLHDGAGGSAQDGDTYLKYYEAHVFSFPTAWYMRARYPLMRVCDDPLESIQLNYLSELDPSWRTGAADYLTLSTIFSNIAAVSGICQIGGIAGLGLSDLCMGTWGPTYPRTGFTNANSQAVASASDAYRALRVTSKPGLRIVLNQRRFDPQGKLQIGAPINHRGKPLNCFAPGTTPLAWDNSTIQPGAERNGYVWVWWERTCCCKLTTGCVGS